MGAAVPSIGLMAPSISVMEVSNGRGQAANMDVMMRVPRALAS